MKCFSTEGKGTMEKYPCASNYYEHLRWNTYWNGRNHFLRGRGRLQDVMDLHREGLWNRAVEGIRAIHLIG
jgi:hypothetical protein